MSFSISTASSTRANRLLLTRTRRKSFSIADLLAKLNTSAAQAPQGSITIIQQGANPALIAQGRVTDPATGFSSTLEFLDPAHQGASALHASGLPIGTPTADSPFAGDGTFTPHVIASNLTSAPQTVTVTMEYPVAAKPGTTAILAPVGKKEFDGESGASVGQMPVASFSVAAYSTEDFSLAAVMSELPLPLPYASVRIQYSGAPGSLLAQAPSVDERQDLVIDTRTMNEGDGWAGSGANPWHLDNQTESILFLTDESDQPARIGFHVVAGGVTYYLTSLKLNPHETRAINIRKLRNVQNADFKKNKIPAGATDGSVEWNRIDNVAVMGCVVVIQKQSGVASSYDCCTCPCPEGYKSLAVSPTICTLIPGSNMELTATATYRACNGPADYYDVSGNATWSSSNTSVAKMDTGLSDQVDGVGAGSCTITATYSDWNYTLSGGACIQNWATHLIGCSVSGVTATITVHFSGSKTTGDNLTFPSTQTCSQSLGLMNCTSPGDWVWNVEVEANVSDDASNWNTLQSFTGNFSGYYRDSSNNLQPFSGTLNQPNDNPESQFTQQPAGQKIIFWIDAPGHVYTYNGYNIDSLTHLEDFTSKVCSKSTPTTCASVKWYFKLVVKSGAVLDTQNSVTGFGSL